MFTVIRFVGLSNTFDSRVLSVSVAKNKSKVNGSSKYPIHSHVFGVWEFLYISSVFTIKFV